MNIQNHEIIAVSDKNESATRARPLPLRPPVEAQVEANATESQSVVQQLRSDPVMARKAKRAIEEAMDATRPVWQKETESFIEQPDHKTRMVAVELYLHNTVGLPVQRTENLNINKTVARETDKHPPAAIAEMRRIIAKEDAEMTSNMDGYLRETTKRSGQGLQEVKS
ncbi:MAG: hypothetical protein H7343_18215 [Undibacterium sp.]|nr:hypothetical protein [Opitutaceae bacterium]